MPENFQYDVFLSHSSKDKAIVRPLAERLRKDGLRVFFDEGEIRPGNNIPSRIEEGLEQSRVLVLCMSTNAFASDWSTLESQTFRFRDPLNKELRFIPLRLRRCHSQRLIGPISVHQLAAVRPRDELRQAFRSMPTASEASCRTAHHSADQALERDSRTQSGFHRS